MSYLQKKKKKEKRIWYLAKLPFRSDGEITIFSDKQKLGNLGLLGLHCRKVLKGVLQGKIKGH